MILLNNWIIRAMLRRNSYSIHFMDANPSRICESIDLVNESTENIKLFNNVY